jgi:hypothetical protein
MNLLQRGMDSSQFRTSPLFRVDCVQQKMRKENRRPELLYENIKTVCDRKQQITFVCVVNATRVKKFQSDRKTKFEEKKLADDANNPLSSCRSKNQTYSCALKKKSTQGGGIWL